MHHRIYKYDVENWWERKCDAFLRKEFELWLKRFRVVKYIVFYSKNASDKYKIFQVKFPEKLFQWFDQLQEALEYEDWIKK